MNTSRTVELACENDWVISEGVEPSHLGGRVVRIHDCNRLEVMLLPSEAIALGSSLMEVGLIATAKAACPEVFAPIAGRQVKKPDRRAAPRRSDTRRQRDRTKNIVDTAAQERASKSLLSRIENARSIARAALPGCPCVNGCKSAECDK